ncbi:hypothetical protein HY995_02340 [Candidatus Micrarchaeota archaeon]|nr:hypothetical protein [Candidatus Micrarchaeota archaeon]MBI5176907.1 hypothetical protein [Candidatus Micrarchaeota archaeon]
MKMKNIPPGMIRKTYRDYRTDDFFKKYQEEMERYPRNGYPHPPKVVTALAILRKFHGKRRTKIELDEE